MDQDAIDTLAGLMVLSGIAAFLLVYVAGSWKAFDKAREPGWSCLIPIYNYYAMCKIGGKSGWWVFLLVIPIVGLFALAAISMGVSRNYGKSELFGLGLAFLPFIFWPILGFDKSVYQGPRRV
ncbi:DUF5684 domain-containing protein [Botrimarina mediterranea]|uniref:Signal peptidase I n=1 Tax=Botrimarina mediterranea TaxID=2528022 RepID=A0A518KDM5_9BACT|nr:DUF5684 domain-containing protein [Botrimarina mediterranea]QDV75890.1 hypothetical protein Spa11_41130 [Botrimarina mediterranea]QDV80485.1 hypothetical protein K2D_41140 [Planctomycetes bacterium K2D]